MTLALLFTRLDERRDGWSYSTIPACRRQVKLTAYSFLDKQHIGDQGANIVNAYAYHSKCSGDGITKLFQSGRLAQLNIHFFEDYD